VPNVLTMMAFQFGHPLAEVVLAESDDLALHNPSQSERAHRSTAIAVPPPRADGASARGSRKCRTTSDRTVSSSSCSDSRTWRTPLLRSNLARSPTTQCHTACRSAKLWPSRCERVGVRRGCNRYIGGRRGRRVVFACVRTRR
jgi:hypothetical protein